MKILLALLATLFFSIAIVAYAQEKNDLIEEHCSECHSTRIIYSKKKTPAQWDKTLQRMIDAHGLKLNADDEKMIKEYLYTLKK